MGPANLEDNSVPRLASPTQGDRTLEGMVQWLSALNGGQIGGFEFVIPLDECIGVIDQHERRFVTQSDGLTLHCSLVLIHELMAEVFKERLGERQPPQRIPCGAKIGPTLLLADRGNGDAHGNEHRTALDELEALVRKYEIDSRRQRSTIKNIQELQRAAVFGRRMRDHAKSVWDRFKRFSLVVHARLRTPPGTLMDEGTVRRIHESHNAVVDGAV